MDLSTTPYSESGTYRLTNINRVNKGKWEKFNKDLNCEMNGTHEHKTNDAEKDKSKYQVF